MAKLSTGTHSHNFIESADDVVRSIKKYGLDDKISEEAKKNNYAMSKFDNYSDYMLYKFCMDSGRGLTQITKGGG